MRAPLAAALARVPCSQLHQWVPSRTANCVIRIQTIRCILALTARQVHTIKPSNGQDATMGTYLLLICKPCSFGNSCFCQSLSLCIAGCPLVGFCIVYSSSMSPLLHKDPDILLRCLQAWNVVANDRPLQRSPLHQSTITAISGKCQMLLCWRTTYSTIKATAVCTTQDFAVVMCTAGLNLTRRSACL